MAAARSLKMLGRKRCALDEKGRLNFPFRPKDDDSVTLVLVPWNRKSIRVFTEERWDEWTLPTESGPMLKDDEDLLWLTSHSAAVVTDKQGRITIPPDLRDYAGLGKEVMVVGANSTAEIVNIDRWLENEAKSNPDKALENLQERGL